MKFVLAFLLLIGISCQIGRGDCAPAETLIGELTEKMGDGIQYTKETFAKYFSYEDMPSIPSAMKDGLESLGDGIVGMAGKAGEMADNTMQNIANSMY